jgi:hypothetical protein
MRRKQKQPVRARQPRRRQPKAFIESDGKDIYVILHGVGRIAKRGRPGTPQAGTWVSLQPGCTVTGREKIEIEYDPDLVHRA